MNAKRRVVASAVAIVATATVLASAVLYRSASGAKTKGTATGSKRTKERALECTIRAERKAYKLGEVPKISVSIRNLTGREIHLVGSLDGSDCKWRYPYCYYEITGPDGKPASKGAARCGNMNGLKSGDFVKVAPGGTFDPYMRTDHGFFACYQLRKETFSSPGKYTMRFVYDAANEDITAWLGDGRFSWKKKKDPELIRLFKQVPKVKIRSNEITIEIGK